MEVYRFTGLVAPLYIYICIYINQILTICIYIYVYIYTHLYPCIIEANATKQVEADEAQALLGPRGILAEGQTVGLYGLDMAGQESIMDEMINFREQTPGNKRRKVVKAIRADPEEFLEAEVMQEATPIDADKSLTPTLLDEAAFASKHACALSVYGLGSEQIEKLESHSVYCRKTYQKLQEILMEKEPTQNQVDAIVQQVPN